MIKGFQALAGHDPESGNLTCNPATGFCYYLRVGYVQLDMQTQGEEGGFLLLEVSKGEGFGHTSTSLLLQDSSPGRTALLADWLHRVSSQLWELRN